MKGNIALVAILQLTLFAAISLAQPVQITLNGSLEMTTGEKFPYKLLLTESGNSIKGFSFTYTEPNETKAAVTGILDKGRRSLSFKETDIIYSRGFHTKAFMCLVNARLEYVQGGKGNVLAGSAISNEADKTSCTGGTIIFGNNEELQNLFSDHEAYDTVITMKKKTINKAEPLKTAKSEKPVITEKITYGVEKSYEWHTDTVVIDIWDGGNVDGDRVTVSFNNIPYLTKYFLVKEKRQLRLALNNSGINTLTIFADNEGSEPPNTANLLLTDGTTQYSILAYNPMGRQAVIKLKKGK